MLYSSSLTPGTASDGEQINVHLTLFFFLISEVNELFDQMLTKETTAMFDVSGGLKTCYVSR